MAAITDLIRAVKDKSVTISECMDILKNSEAVASGAVWGAVGHPLQHSARSADGTGRRLGDDYHFRGPLPIEKELKGGPNIGSFKAAIKVEADGSFTPKSNTFHSQFTDDAQAGMCLKLVLESGGGAWALDLLRNYPRVSVTVTYGMPGGTQYVRREAHLVAAGRPASNIIAKADAESTSNFVLIDREDMGCVVATLRAKEAPAGHLHVQTLYPSSDADVPAGRSTVSVVAKSPGDYSGPASLSFP